MTRVLAIDAGLSSGWAVLDFELNSPPVELALYQGKMGLIETVDRICETYKSYEPDVVVTEKFNLRPGNKFLADLTTVSVNGALQYAMHDKFGVEMVEQTPAQAKGLVSDKVLKRLGMWPTGSIVGAKDADDVRDALRHAVHFGVVELKHRPTAELGWPQEKEECCGSVRGCLTCPEEEI